MPCNPCWIYTLQSQILSLFSILSILPLSYVRNQFFATTILIPKYSHQGCWEINQNVPTKYYRTLIVSRVNRLLYWLAQICLHVIGQDIFQDPINTTGRHQTDLVLGCQLPWQHVQTEVQPFNWTESHCVSLSIIPSENWVYIGEI